MSLTKDEVKKVAKLANLPLTSEEEEKYSEQLSKILEYVEQLNKVNTDDVEPTFNVSGETNVTSEDKIGSCLTQEEALANVSKIQSGSFVTKGVFDPSAGSG